MNRSSVPGSRSRTVGTGFGPADTLSNATTSPFAFSTLTFRLLASLLRHTIEIEHASFNRTVPRLRDSETRRPATVITSFKYGGRVAYPVSSPGNKGRLTNTPSALDAAPGHAVERAA